MSNSPSRYGSQSTNVAPTSSRYGSQPTSAAPSPSRYGSQSTAQSVKPAAQAAAVNRDAGSAAKTATVSREQSQKAMADYKASQSKFQGKPSAASANYSGRSVSYTPRSSSSTGYSYTRGTREVRYNTYYSSVGYSPRPYVYYGPSYFGFWDTVFLYSMLNAHNHAFFYHHQNDPAIRSFQTQVEQQAVKDADLQRQLNESKAEIAALKNRGIAPDENYLPNGVDPDIAHTQEYVDKNQDKFYAKAPEMTQSQKAPEKSFPWMWTFIGLVVVGGVGSWFIFGRRT